MPQGPNRRHHRRPGHAVHGECLSPPWASTLKLSADGRTILRASYGRFSQGVFTGELNPSIRFQADDDDFDFDPATSDYTKSPVGGRSRSTCCSIPGRTGHGPTNTPLGGSRGGPRLAAAIAYVRKDGSDFIGWTEVAGQYLRRRAVRRISMPVFASTPP